MLRWFINLKNLLILYSFLFKDLGSSLAVTNGSAVLLFLVVDKPFFLDFLFIKLREIRVIQDQCTQQELNFPMLAT
uniref:Putative secreted protein n=1 Tax=Anopheles triannulatus TaxID=58253 RepID=A0A2M4B771_9DIPT